MQMDHGSARIVRTFRLPGNLFHGVGHGRILLLGHLSAADRRADDQLFHGSFLLSFSVSFAVARFQIAAQLFLPADNIKGDRRMARVITIGRSAWEHIF